MENIIRNIVMLIDMYYYRKRLMKRWRSIKRYQRTGIIGSKPSGLLISKNPPLPKKLVNTELDYYSMNRAQVQSRHNSRSPSNDLLKYLNSIGADIWILNSIHYDLFKLRIKYKERVTDVQFTDNQNDAHVFKVIKNLILDIERQVYSENLKLEKDKEKLAKKNNPHGLEVGKQYLVRYKHYYESHFTLITVTRFSDLGFPYIQCSTGYRYNGIISPNSYDIKTTDGKWIHNCKQWDEFQAKKKLKEQYDYYKFTEQEYNYLKFLGVEYQFKLLNLENKHSEIIIKYKNHTESFIFFTKPLKTDLINTIITHVKIRDNNISLMSSVGLQIHNPQTFSKLIIQS